MLTPTMPNRVSTTERLRPIEYIFCAAAFADAKSSKTPATILLSPACASWDQYNSFEHRGAHFEEIVASL